MSALSVARRRTESRAFPRKRDQSGAVAVEFALILPILAMLLLGIVTAGLSYSHAVGLTNAVREGSRFGASTVSVSTWPTAVEQRVRDTQFDDFSTPPGTLVCARLMRVQTAPTAPTQVWSSCSPGAGLTAYPGGPPALVTTGSTAGTCLVQVYAARRYSIVLGLFPGVKDKLMTRSSTARYERTC